MTVLAMLSFDNMTARAANTNDAIFPVNYPSLLKSPVSTKDISLVQTAGSSMVAIRYASYNDTDGSPTMYWQMYAPSASATVSVNNQYLVGPPIAEAGFDKTGKWYFGTMVFVPSVIAGNVALGVIGDADTPANNRTVIGSSTAGAGKVVAVNTAYYVEFEIDWANKTVKGYVDGVQTASTTFATTPIAFIGNAQTAAYYPADAAQAGWFNGTSVINNPSYAPAFSHIYFIVDKLNDSAPTGRPGPVKVRVAPVATVDVVGDMTTSAADFVTAANTPVTLGLLPTNRITADSGGAKSTFHFATPTLNANEATILAAQLELFTYKERDAAANAMFSFGDGTTNSKDYTVVSTENQRRDVMCLNAPFSGVPWTPAEIGKLVIKLASVRN